MMFTALLAMAVGAPALKDKDKSSPLVGEWEVESAIYDGAPMAFKGYRCEFTAAGNFSMYRADRKTSTYTPYRVDAGTDPPGFTFTYPDRESPGIYKIDGTALTICYARPGSDLRPTAFESAKGSGSNLIVLRRVKTKE